MKKIILTLLLGLAIMLYSCTNKSYPTGNPSEILPASTYSEVQKKYQEIFNFEEGTAIVKSSKFGLIDEFGKEILPCEYDSITSVMKDVRFAKRNKKYCVVNKDGEAITECIYADYAHQEFYNFIPVKLNGKWGFLNYEGKEAIQFKFDELSDIQDSDFVAKYNGQFGVSDYSGKELVPFEYDEIMFKPYKKDGYGLSWVSSNQKWGMLNSDNHLVTKCEFSFFSYPVNGYMVVRRGESDSSKSSEKALIDAQTGKEVIPFGKYQDIGNYCEGLIMVEREDNKCAYIDIKGKIIIPFQYYNCGDFSEGLALVHKLSGTYVHTLFGSQQLRKGGFIDKTGRVVIPFKFTELVIASICKFKDGLAPEGYSNDHIGANHMGYINKKGKYVVPPIYDETESFENGLGRVCLNDKYGYVNTKGVLVIPCIYDDFQEYTDEGIIALTKDKETFYFDYNGNKTTAPKESKFK